MQLNKDEEAILAGEKGPGRQRAMELLVALGKIYDARRLVPITSAHLSGVSYKTIGEGGIDFLEEMAKDCKVVVKTTLNPMGMDAKRWKEMRIDERFAQKQLRIVAAYEKMGVETTCSCTPYLAGNVPRLNDHIAWAESSALSFANSMLGARTNREGGPGALAAAILGRTPEYGLHLDENRRPTVVIEADIGKGITQHSLLGHIVGARFGAAVPYFRGIRPTVDEAKTMAAAMAAAGSVALFHIEGVTPHHKDQITDGLEVVHVGRNELDEMMAKLDSGLEPDLIALGCPHLSIEEVKDIAASIKGRKKKKNIEVWFCTSRDVVAQCPDEAAELERFGKVVCDTCMVVAPIEGSHKVTATNS
ncbi:MAG TPA: aconitase X catalytic domain-containing protein, partial [Methanomassiliicoccales archaeon]|nr:aconitase X catalytic domain-containing protein [Methanomassiliicoccales archaeon]